MFKFITTLTFFLFGLLAKGQVSETRTVTDFSKIEVKHATVIYTESDYSSLTIESDYNDTSETIKTEIDNGTLKISGTNEQQNTVVYVSGKATQFKAGRKANIKVTNTISAENVIIILNSGAEFIGNLIAQNEVRINASKGTTFKGYLDTNLLTGNFNSNAQIIICGNAQKAVIAARHSVLCHARNFVAHSLEINADGKSEVRIFADKLVAINVGDEAKVTYNGHPLRVKLNTCATAFNKGKTDQTVSYNY